MEKSKANEAVILLDNISRMEKAIEIVNKENDYEVLFSTGICGNREKLNLTSKEKRLLRAEISEFLYVQLERYEEQLEKI